MARIVPTLVVAAINQFFSFSVRDEVENGRWYEREQIPNLRAVIELVRKIPTELISVRSEYYADIIASIAGIEATLAHWPEAHFRERLIPLRPVALLVVA